MFRRKPAKRPHIIADIRRQTLGRAIAAGPIKTALVTSVGALLIGGAAYLSVIEPVAIETASARLMLQTQMEKNRDAQAVRASKPQFLNEFRQALEAYDAARAQLPEEQEVALALAEVRDMAMQDGVRVVRFEATKPEARTKVAGKLYAQSIPAEVTGGHAAIARFLIKLGKYDRIVHIRKFDFRSLKKQEAVSLDLATYSLLSPGELPPVPVELQRPESARLRAPSKTATSGTVVTQEEDQ